MKEWYGSLTNRLEENRMFCETIEVGTGMTKYSWSDRHPYEVVEVVDQKHVFVRELDHKKADDIPMSNNWLLFSNEKNPVIELVFRYNHWNQLVRDDDGEKKYFKVNVSFGVAEYYYDYEF